MSHITYNKRANAPGQNTPGHKPKKERASMSANTKAGKTVKEKQEPKKQKPKSSESVLLKLVTLLFALFMFFLLVRGWMNSEDSIIVAKEGAGYYLGIIGGSMMLLLMLYPARKHMKFLRNLGKVRYWFRIHMILGIMGPLLILFHSNFTLGSPNSAVAMLAMLLVVASGIIGRFIYRQVHNLKNNHHYTYGQMRQVLENQKNLLSHRLAMSAASIKIIDRFEHYLAKKTGFWSHLLALPVINVRSREYTGRLIRLIRKQIYSSPEYRQMPRKAKKHLFFEYKELIELYFYNVRRAANYSIYEKLFALWHVLHFPLFIVLFFTSVLHVIVVHMY